MCVCVCGPPGLNEVGGYIWGSVGRIDQRGRGEQRQKQSCSSASHQRAEQKKKHPTNRSHAFILKFAPKINLCFEKTSKLYRNETQRIYFLLITSQDLFVIIVAFFTLMLLVLGVVMAMMVARMNGARVVSGELPN